MTGVGAPPRVALVGASGHGLWHRRIIAPLHDAGKLELVALVDVRPVEAAPDAPVPPGTSIFTDHREMLGAVRPDVVVICTPPHTHLPIALDAIRAGADLLLEKPPVLSLAEHRTLAGALAEAGRVAQIGFQALGSTALRELTSAVADGRLGRVTGVSTVASWQRTDGYYARAPWAGRRSLDGRPALDGVLVNPLAHAVMQCLAVAGVAVAAGAVAPLGAVDGAPPDWPAQVELERYRTRPIEVDDTAALRATLGCGLPLLAAVTLAGEDFIAGEVIVHGTTGRAVLEYTADRLTLPGDPGPREVPGRVNLLENLLENRADPGGVPLIAPLARTAAFTALVQAISAAPEPELVGGDRVVATGAGPDRVLTIRGVNAVLRRAAAEGVLLSELAVPWAVKPHRAAVERETGDA
ncbi:Gfo/Idh/MocA family oxidoreductase [Plantactinospora sp. KLBMP9567]|uniref:Gfo/Idh/MocA family protein n=1 Tax=Plantactinospora sp. KLBMP9567 TaxID=3085900 RepID=UPI002981B135|nr:Gfo/Idh/MocA family oxidoreductase [Plantactinospora sp. KLBMP9567]MDW5325449.1 Gfo/Idh/MocA family oxidoreductase [Plantactinospora sp. KLBMP9567]